MPITFNSLKLQNAKELKNKASEQNLTTDTLFRTKLLLNSSNYKPQSESPSRSPNKIMFSVDLSSSQGQS